MPDVENVIKGLEAILEETADMFYRSTIQDALALLKAQEPEVLDMPKPDSDIGCWYDITHNYTLEQVVKL